ncbi:MAG: phosphoglycerate kinase [Desulfovibrio sp.]
MNFVKDIDIAGKRLLMRVDFNVPLKGSEITDDNRIRASIPTFEYLLDQDAAIIVCAHLGKPKGKIVPELTLEPVAKRLGELLGKEVRLAPDCTGEETAKMAAELKGGEILMLQNLRFNPEETGKTEADRGDFGKKLAALAPIYVNDAFGVAHRENASVVDVPKHAETTCMGLLLKKEWDYLGGALAAPKKPFAAISGGAKVSTKLGVITNLLGKVDHLIIGGAMANTFMLALGNTVGNSLTEPDLVDTAKSIIKDAESKGTKLHLPVDFTAGTDISAQEPMGVYDATDVPDDAVLLDIGPKTIENFNAVLREAGTAVWNGPMGMFETPAFSEGSFSLCRTLAARTDCLTIVGGGDTDAILHTMHLEDKFSFVSTGGGSFLEFLEGKELPAFKALKESV